MSNEKARERFALAIEIAREHLDWCAHSTSSAQRTATRLERTFDGLGCLHIAYDRCRSRSYPTRVAIIAAAWLALTPK